MPAASGARISRGAKQLSSVMCACPCVPPRRYDQPYQYALYCLGVACEERRWHVADYEAALPGLAAQQLEVW